MKNKKLSIAFVNNAFVPESYGGSEHQTLRLTSNLKAKDIEKLTA